MAFQPGQSGNPAGRPRGSVNRQLLMLRDAADQILPVLIEKALAGDMDAAKLILDRGVPKMKPVSPPEAISLPGGGLMDQIRALLQQVASGEVSASAAGEMLDLMSSAVHLATQGKKANIEAGGTPQPQQTCSTYLAMLQKRVEQKQELM